MDAEIGSISGFRGQFIYTISKYLLFNVQKNTLHFRCTNVTNFSQKILISFNW